MRIGEAARITGVSARSLRFYEQQGLIVPGRCANGYRDYCRSTLESVLTIRALLRSGLPISLIKRAVRSGADSSGRATVSLDEVARYRDRLAERIAALHDQRARLDAFLVSPGTAVAERT